jgi:hypothetical protein
MAGISERNNQQNELGGLGYSLRYIDEWQPKTVLYRHKPDYNVDGDIVQDVGSAVKGIPGNPDYVLKKSKIGQFGWPPSESCTCRWCRSRDWGGTAEAKIVEAVPNPSVRKIKDQAGRHSMGPHMKT